jgi:PIN domain nuclease of toxin-antitoxin system
MGSDALSLLLDTHVLLWALNDEERLGTKARKRIDRESTRGTLSVSAISFWEIALLTLRRRVAVTPAGAALRAHVLGLGVHELAIDGAVAELAGRLSSNHADPADCLLVATALEHDVTLVTADAKLLAWGGRLKTLNAER